MKKVIVIGASSGIGLAVTEKLIEAGYSVGGCARSSDKLQMMREKLGQHFYPCQLDIRDAESVDGALSGLINTMGGMDICIVGSGISRNNREMDWSIERDVIETNVTGYTAALNFAARYFKKQKLGHIVGITSLAKYFGNINPAYCASKAFEAIYLEGLRLKLECSGVTVTEIIPGFVDTPMIAYRSRKFWIVSADKAASQIVRAIEKKKRTAFISGRWAIFRYILPWLPYVIKRPMLMEKR